MQKQYQKYKKQNTKHKKNIDRVCFLWVYQAGWDVRGVGCARRGGGSVRQDLIVCREQKLKYFLFSNGGRQATFELNIIKPNELLNSRTLALSHYYYHY